MAATKSFSSSKYFKRQSAMQSTIPTMIATMSMANAEMIFTNPTDINTSEFAQFDLGFIEYCLLNLSKNR